MDDETKLERSKECRCRWGHTLMTAVIWPIWIIEFRHSYFDWPGLFLGIFTLAAAITLWWIHWLGDSAAGDEHG